jgi:2-keto-3-deoxy-L-arabinonate dehydratase
MTPPRLRGCIPILCTPLDDEGQLDFASFDRQIEWVIAEGASGVATLALASEGYKLLDSWKPLLAARAVEVVNGRVPVVVSVDAPGTAPAVDRALRMEACGASALMVLPPSFIKPDPANLFDYYAQIGSAVKIPVIIQDAPQLTGVAMGPGLWARLANEIPTIKYVKAEGTPQGVTISETIRQSEGELSVFCGWGGLGMLDAMERGAAGSMPAANFTRYFAEIQTLWEAGDCAAAEARFASELPFVLWAMQSLDFSVATTKEELRRRGVFASARQLAPAAGLDPVSQAQLTRFIDRRLASNPV